MKFKLIPTLIFMSKLFFGSLFIQTVLFSTLLASNGNSQDMLNANKVFISVEFKDASLIEVFKQIESKTDFTFSYEKKDLDRNVKIDLMSNKLSVADILQEVSRVAKLKFKQVNNNLNISKMTIETSQSYEVELRPVISITGRVTSDSDNTGLPGVTVMEKGTDNGTVTNIDGEYTINVTNEDAVLVFSFIGYTTQEVMLEGRTAIDVALAEDVKNLEEVVVVGYGTAKKSDLTGAIGTVGGDAIAERKTTQVSQALQGAIPGLMVTRNNNAPGATADIRIRGITSIGDSNPLVIVDGVPFDNINDINPNDIESISVLKDAASASIYGARAAAGVILVTTKRGVAGQSRLTYNFEFGIETPTILPEYTGPVRYMEVANEMAWNDNDNNANEYPIYPRGMVEDYLSLNRENPDLYPITDWSNLILNKTAPRQSHQFSYTGGSEKLQTNASLGYDKVDGLFDGRSYERLTARMNNDVTINDYLSADVNFFFKRTMSQQPVSDPMYYSRIAAPIYAAEWSDGRLAGGKTGNNPYGRMKYGGSTDNWYNQVGGKVSLDFAPIEGLKISGVLAPTINFDKRKSFIKQVPYYSWNDPAVLEGYLQGHVNTNLYENRNDSWRVTSQLLANYTKSLGNHSLNLLLGYENFRSFTENLGASREQYLLSSFPYLNLGPLEFRGNEGSAWENAYRSYFGRIMYNFNNRYLLQANIRYDASSRFHHDYRWGSFPSFSAGWVVSEESFMPEVPGLSFLKLRASWGTLGNERIGNYPYQSTIGFSNGLFYRGDEIVSAQTAAQWQYNIRDISWETTESFDFGIDASFLKDRLQFTGDYYIKTTNDMLLALEIPDYIGFDNPDQNTGSMSTKGWEVQLGWNDNIGEFGYSASFNLSDFRSVMGDLGGTQFLGDQITSEGSEFNEWYGYKSDGLFQTQEEVNDSPTLNSSVKPGDIKYLDISGPEGGPDGIITPEYDRVLLGGSLPRFLYGGNVRIYYKGLEFSMVVQGVGRQNARLAQNMVRPLQENWGNVPSIIDGNYWSVYNTEEQNRSARYPRLSEKSVSNNYVMSDYWLFDGSYFRLKNVTIGYKLPEQLTEKVKMPGVRVFASANDVLSIHNYPKGWDPEAATSSYPITTSYVFGATVNF